MKKALIDPNGRLCHVEATEFPVAPPFTWVDVADDVTPNTHVYDGVIVKLKPPKTKEKLDAEANAVADVKIKVAAEQIMADLIVFVAGMQGAPQSLKDAANIIAAEKAKKPK